MKSLPVAVLRGISLRYGKTMALAGIDLDLPAGALVGLIGPDGVGKSSLLALVAGARALQQGQLSVLGGDMALRSHREEVCPRIAYMPQGLGKNLYPTLSVEENLQFFGRLFGHGKAERRSRIDDLTGRTGMRGFLDRPAGKLSGGMRQKLSLCCALIHDPDLLILDEPTTGVDPLSRRQFWALINDIRRERGDMSVVVATAYMEEAEDFDFLVAMNAGQVLATGEPAALRKQTASVTLEDAFIALLPEAARRGHTAVVVPPLAAAGAQDIVIEAHGLTKRFGDFTAVDHVDFRIRRGEIFGFLGSNGCGKSTTMKMLTGLLPASEGSVRLFGKVVDASDIEVRRRVGYMSQSFSLYSELTVRQNLVLHARIFALAPGQIQARVDELLTHFGLVVVADSLPATLPLGVRQRLSLAVAVVHRPELLILDEPTSGVDPIARDMFWRLIVDLSRLDHVTIFISTHFMNEAARCDRISLMNAGQVLVTATPAVLVSQQGTRTLEEAFIAILKAAPGDEESALPSTVAGPSVRRASQGLAPPPRRRLFSIRRAWSCTLREVLELQRDPVRATLALLGSALLMFIIGYGINLDVENLSFAVLDLDQTVLSRSYVLDLSGSRYFSEHTQIADHAALDLRMRSGELALAIEIPPGFARNIERGTPVQIGAWVDGAMPTRAETIRGYVLAMHQGWLADMAVHRLGMNPTQPVSIETRYRYNPDVRSLPAMVPAVIPLLLMIIPAMLTALSVVREKELGSIINLYVTPVTRTEFLLGKQLPYVVLAMLNFALLTVLAAAVFGVPVKGSLLALTLGAAVFVLSSTGLGLLVSTFTRSQIAAMFITLIITIIPCVQFAGLLNPVSSLEGMGAIIGHIYPATHFLDISRGVFNKALGMRELEGSMVPLLLAVPAILGLAIVLLKKQEA